MADAADAPDSADAADAAEGLQLELSPSRRERAARWLWGYDIFISYSWTDGGEIAAALAQKLRDAGFKVFRDRSGVNPGDRLAPTIARALRRSSCIVIVATRGALGAKWVAAEVELADRLGRATIPIACGDVVASIDALHAVFRERLRLERPAAPFVDQELVNAIAGSLGSLRQARVRFAIVSSVLAVVLALAAIAGGLFVVARHERDDAQRSRDLAERAQHVSEAERLALASSVARRDERPVEALLLATEAVRESAPPIPQPVESSLRDALAAIGGVGVPVFDGPAEHIFEVGPGVVAASTPNRTATWRVSAPAAAPVLGEAGAGLLIVFDEDDAVPVVDHGGVLRTWAADGAVRTLAPLRGFDPARTYAARSCGIAQLQAGDTAATMWRFDGSVSTAAVGGKRVSLSPSCRHVAIEREHDVVVADASGPAALAHAPIRGEHASWSDDGQWLVVAGGDGGGVRVSVVAAATGKVFAVTAPREQRPFHRFAFAPAAKTLAAVDDQGHISVWRDFDGGHAQPADVAVLADYTRNGTVSETSLAFSPDGRWLVASDSTREAVLVDLALASQAGPHTLYRMDQNGHTTLPALRSPLAFTSDSKLLFIVDDRDLLDVWSLGQLPVRVAQLHGHDGGFTALRVLADGTLVTGGQDGSLRRWPRPPGDPPASWDASRAQWRASPIELRGGRVNGVDGTSRLDIAVGPGDQVIAGGTEFPLRRTHLLADGSVAPWTPLTAEFAAPGGTWSIACDANDRCSRVDAGGEHALPAGMAVVDVDRVGGAILLARGSDAFALWTPDQAAAPEPLPPPVADAHPVAITARDRRVLWRSDAAWTVTGGGSAAVPIDDPDDRARFCLDGRAVCASHIHWLAARHPDADRDAQHEQVLLDTGSCMALVGDDDARVVGPACSATVPLAAITGIRCDPSCDRWAAGTQTGQVQWRTPRASLPILLAPAPIHDLAWADDSGLVVATRPGTWIEATPGAANSAPSVVTLWPPDVDTVSALANPRWIVIGGDDQVLRFYARSIDELVALAKQTAGRELRPDELAHWRITTAR